MPDFIDHNEEAHSAVLTRARYVGRPQHRALPKRNALVVSAALVEARRVMAGNEHLKTIEEVLSEDIFESVELYVATFIPVGEDDDLRGAFENIIVNSNAETLYDEAAFARLDADLEEFRRDQLTRLGQFPWDTPKS